MIIEAMERSWNKRISKPDLEGTRTLQVHILTRNLFMHLFYFQLKMFGVYFGMKDMLWGLDSVF